LQGVVRTVAYSILALNITWPILLAWRAKVRRKEGFIGSWLLVAIDKQLAPFEWQV